jgi:hypothetical protein
MIIYLLLGTCALYNVKIILLHIVLGEHIEFFDHHKSMFKFFICMIREFLLIFDTYDLVGSFPFCMFFWETLLSQQYGACVFALTTHTYAILYLDSSLFMFSHDTSSKEIYVKVFFKCYNFVVGLTIFFTSSKEVHVNVLKISSFVDSLSI